MVNQNFRLAISALNGTKIEIVTTSHEDANEVIRHSAAHIMAQAVQKYGRISR